MQIFAYIFLFFAGFYFSKWKHQKKIEITRLLAIRAFISSYCEKLRKMADFMLSKQQDESIKDEEKTHIPTMLAVLSNGCVEKFPSAAKQ